MFKNIHWSSQCFSQQNFAPYALCYALRIIDFCLSNSQVLFFLSPKAISGTTLKVMEITGISLFNVCIRQKTKMETLPKYANSCKNRQR